MTRWLIVLGMCLVLGVVILQLGDDPLLDEPAAATPRPEAGPGHFSSPSPGRDAAQPGTPARCPASPPGPVSSSHNAGSAPADHASHDAPSPTTRGSSLAGEPELVALLLALRAECVGKEDIPPECLARLTSYLLAHPASARAAARVLFDLPVALTAMRTTLHQALINTKLENVQQIIAQTIEQRLQARLAALPATREELLAVLATGTVQDQEHALEGLRREYLSDPTLLDYLFTTAQDARLPWMLRDKVIASLGRVRTHASGDLLLRLFHAATAVEERTALMGALASHARALPHLRRTMQVHACDPQQPMPVRRSALRGLADTPPDPSSRQMLLDVLNRESDKYMRRIAIDGLRRYENDATTETLLRAHRKRETDEQVLRTIDRILNT